MPQSLELIDQLIATRKDAFDREVIDPKHKPFSFDFSQEALNFLFIPKRLLEVVPHFEDVTVKVEATSHSLLGLVKNHKVDTKLLLFIRLFSIVTSPEAPVLRVTDYEDDEQLQRKGIATNFYTNLGYCAGQMGFRFIQGNNYEEREYNFFTSKLGRAPLKHTKPEFWELLHERPEKWSKLYKYCTIDFLREEDRKQYYDPNATKEDWERFIDRQ